MMTDSSAPDLSTAPNPTILDPAAQSGQCAPTDQHPPKRRSQRDPFSMDQDQEMKISESVQFSDEFENRGLLESSTRLKPHEAQSYRKKALWVSWVSILVTIALAVAAFTVSIMRHSASAFLFQFDAVLDVLSSIILLWLLQHAKALSTQGVHVSTHSSFQQQVLFLVAYHYQDNNFQKHQQESSAVQSLKLLAVLLINCLKATQFYIVQHIHIQAELTFYRGQTYLLGSSF
ncbi:transmembrane protein 163-like [Huso huso]|uniref:Transmembrane protein 163-like n=1 Tax=Huso huso TaxID=61971 RepID=A0ABR0ZK47_HUSHU